ncbi:MAG: bifunctional phosphopantothenoylcysteine decarboxylase/phosphopantothenate--cysteine ligase CoaBC [Cyclobacteriaceae bacterium]
MLAGKKILLAVSGSIAAYKTAFFVRLLVKEGAEVKVIMTESAKAFIGPITLSTLSKNPVYSTFEKGNNGEWTNHVELGLWADLMIVAPATANTIAKMANGICDNLLIATYLSARCLVMIAPAMDLDMYEHISTQQNLEKLSASGNVIIEAQDGELASGLSGVGRMEEPEQLIKSIAHHFRTSKLNEKIALITSGPTYEPVDAVRFIGNHSSGKMGRAIALELANRGMKVHFITGPTAHLPKHPLISILSVQTADEMFETAKKHHKSAEICVFAAAVADYKPADPSDKKHKRNGEKLKIDLIENPDIAKELGHQKVANQIHVGFALETHDEEAHAKEKLNKKNFDLIVLNSLRSNGAGFAHNTNKVTIYDHNKKHEFELKSKELVAKDIADLLEEKC